MLWIVQRMKIEFPPLQILANMKCGRMATGYPVAGSMLSTPVSGHIGVSPSMMGPLLLFAMPGIIYGQ
jgi:hypothetical protein